MVGVPINHLYKTFTPYFCWEHTMQLQENFINKVSQSSLITFNLEDFYDKRERKTFDIKDCLYMELILKEKDFREYIKTNDWSIYANCIVNIICSADAIVPTWAYMLVVTALQPFTSSVYFCDEKQLEDLLFDEKISALNVEIYNGKKIVVKGCGDIPVPVSAYVKITSLLAPVAQSIMYGEPCSTVPVLKRKI